MSQSFEILQMRKVKKNHQMLEKLSQEMLQLPTKKERNQIEDLKAVLSATKEEHAKKETRWRLTVLLLLLSWSFPARCV